MLAPRTLATEPPPSGPAAARLVWMDPTRAAVGGDGIARAEVRALLKGMAVLVHAVAPSAAHGRGLMSEKLTRPS